MMIGTSRRVPKAATFVKDPKDLARFAPAPAPKIFANNPLNVKSI